MNVQIRLSFALLENIEKTASCYQDCIFGRYFMDCSNVSSHGDFSSLTR